MIKRIRNLFLRIDDNLNHKIMNTSSGLIKLDSYILADYILKNYGPMSHLKLQKLLFYCDSYHLAYFEQELITDKFEAWVHGPVSRKIFNTLKDKSLLYSDLSFDGDGVKIDSEFNNLTSDQRDLINNVLSELSKWTGLELESSTHKEEPWIEARNGYAMGDRCDVLISKNTTLSYYKNEMNGK